MKLKKLSSLVLPDKFKINYDYFLELQSLECYTYGDWTIVLGKHNNVHPSRIWKAYALHIEHGLYEVAGESHHNIIIQLFTQDLIPLGVPFHYYFLPKFEYISHNENFIAVPMLDSEKEILRGDYKVLENYQYRECCTIWKEGGIHFNKELDYYLHPHELSELQRLAQTIAFDHMDNELISIDKLYNLGLVDNITYE